MKILLQEYQLTKIKLAIYVFLSDNPNIEAVVGNAVKPLHSGQHRDLEKVTAMRRCTLYRGLTFSQEILKRIRYPH